MLAVQVQLSFRIEITEAGLMEEPIISVDPDMIQAGKSTVTQTHSCYRAVSQLHPSAIMQHPERTKPDA